MTIVEQIRAEVERLMRKNSSSSGLEGGVLGLTYEDGIDTALNNVLEILSFLSTLEKDEKPMNSNEGLEEEFIRYIHEKDAEVSERSESTYAQEDLEDIARHFAQWGAEHRGSSEIPNDLEEAALEFADREYMVGDVDRSALYKGFWHGAKWQKVQLMKEAVDSGMTVGDINRKLWYVPEDFKVVFCKEGDKVKLIIVKED